MITLEQKIANQQIIAQNHAAIEAQYDREAIREGFAICRHRHLGGGALSKGKRLLGGVTPMKFRRTDTY